MKNFEEYKKSRGPAPIDKKLLWNRIESDLETPAFQWKKVLAYAAVILMCSSIAFQYGKFQQGSKAFEFENHYSNLINYEVTLINANESLSLDQKEEYLEIIEDLNEENDALRDMLSGDINNAQILEAMISNYQNSLNLLRELQRNTSKQRTLFKDEQSIIL